MKSALITGIAGQDGSYLAEFLLEKDYKVFGFLLKDESLDRIEHLKNKITLIEGNLTDQESIKKAIKISNPDEVYHLGAISFMETTWKQPILTAEVNALGTLKLIEEAKNSKLFIASSCEIFSHDNELKTETSNISPENHYSASKAFSFYTSKIYRKKENKFICNGILFNHESSRRTEQFVTKKIISSAVKIKNNQLDFLELGNLDSRRDWGYAKDFVEAFWLILQQETPKDYIICTGELNSVRNFVEKTFKALNMPIIWEGEGINEVGKYNNKTIIKISKEFFRENETPPLQGNNSKIKSIGWKPKISFSQLINIMVTEEQKALK
jgi:GDPmannose 4,6-dehydratase